MKILLINAIDPRSEAQARFPSLGLGYLAATVPEHEVRIVDRDIEREISSFLPDLVGITAVTQNYKIACSYAWTAKHYDGKRNIPVIIGGPHISALPDTATKDMDLIVMGEAEEVFPKLIHEFLERGELLPGCVYPGIPISPLDKIPHPVREKVGHTAGIFSSRGCPYRCYFCFSSRFWGKVRFFSAEYVLEELKELAGRGARRISFHDDLFVADQDRLHRLVELINREPSLRKVKFRVNARANLVNEHTAWMLSQMHVDTVGLGLESGNPRVLRALKGGITVEDNYAAIIKLHKYGIAANASFVIGYPDETEDEIMDTYRFIKESDLDFIDVYVLTPFPGTPAWKDAGLSVPMDWDRLNVNYGENPNPVVMSHLGKETIDRLYRKFKRLRLFRAARRIYFQPMFGDVCRAGLNKVLTVCR